MNPGWGAQALLAGLLGCACAARAAPESATAGIYGATLGAGAATAVERGAFGQNPAAIRPGWAGCHAHVYHPFGLENLRVAEAGGFWDFRAHGSAAVWRQVRVEDWYREDAGEWSQTWRPARAKARGGWEAGASVSAWSMRLPGWRRQGWTQGLGAGWRALPGLKLGAFARGDFLAPGREGLVLQGGAEASQPTGYGGGPPRQSLHLDFRKRGSGPWKALAGMTVRPYPGLQVSGGCAGGPFQFSLGVRLGWGGLTVNQALRYHRHLGRTTLSGLGFSRSRVEQPRTRVSGH